ncbi:MAG: carbohydrate ABC transporter substrate-binding protein, partial [Anaerolineales bacterium]|nr:carbohydrate ABC transporter substrate-binding protein [Anaerolineales bacterium]
QAGVEVPTGDTTWEEWADLTRQVAEATGTDFAMAMDRTGHRFAGPAISQGAKYFDANGNPAIADAGFQAMSQMLVDWHADGTMPLDVWAGSSGYAPANELFVNGQIVLYMSGSWQIGQFATTIGDAFDWQVIPNPCGPAACSGMPGGAALVPIKDTQHPEEVGMLMDYLAQEDVLREFSARTLFIPGHLGLAEAGIAYETDVEAAANALSAFVAQVPLLDQTAYDLQAYPFNFAIFNATRDRLTQVILGELTMDEAMARIQEDVDQAIAEATGTAVAAATPVPPAEPVELRMTWYSDGTEDVVMRELLDRFEAENPGITVVMDVVAYNTILENLPIQLAAGEGPDLARVTNLGGLSEFYLDISPYVNAAYWEENFGPFLNWVRPAGDTSGIYGMMTQLTVTGPYINKTLFDQAGVEVPTGNVTWEEWAELSRQVAEATGTDFALAMDRTGHRFAGPAISQGAMYFDADGNPVVDDEGFRAMSQMLVDWHADGTMPLDVWAGSSGYAPANEMFVNGQVVMYMSGSWQIGQFASTIGDNFDWQVVPNPCGPAACTGMPGGAALVPIKDTEHPAEVARVMDFLAQEDVLREFSARTLFIPGHLGLAASGVEYDTDLAAASNALSVFVSQVGELSPVAFDLQAYPFNFAIFNATRDRLTQVILGELTLDEAMVRIQEDVDQAIAEAGG